VTHESGSPEDFDDLPVLPPRSVLLPVHPIGLGTWKVEGLPSFLFRLLQVHRINWAQLKSIVQSSITSAKLLVLKQLYAELGGIAIGGVCPNTHAWVDGLSVLLPTDEIVCTTLLCLEGRVSNRKLLSRQRRQCSKCADEVAVEGHHPHLLLWMIETVVVCPIHGCPLETVPPGIEYRRARWRLRKDAILQNQSPVRWEVPNSQDDVKLEIARSRLVAAFLQSRLFKHFEKVTPQQSVAGFLNGACQSLYQGICSRLATQLLVSKGGLHDWMCGLHLPSFGQVVDIAQALDSSIEAVLLGDTSQLPLFPPEYRKRMAKVPHTIHNTGSPEFRAELERTIRKRRNERGKFAPISISEIAQIMRVDRKSIVVAHPDIASRLSLDYREKRASISRLTRSVRHHAYREAAIILAQSGKLPTRNRVMELLEEISVFSLGDMAECHRVCMEIRTEFRIRGRR